MKLLISFIVDVIILHLQSVYFCILCVHELYIKSRVSISCIHNYQVAGLLSIIYTLYLYYLWNTACWYTVWYCIIPGMCVYASSYRRYWEQCNCYQWRYFRLATTGNNRSTSSICNLSDSLYIYTSLNGF